MVCLDGSIEGGGLPTGRRWEVSIRLHHVREGRLAVEGGERQTDRLSSCQATLVCVAHQALVVHQGGGGLHSVDRNCIFEVAATS